jgi:hypothetical protein
LPGSKQDGSNGGSAEVIPVDQIVLTYDRVHDRLEIGAQCNSLDLMLDMLARATRTLDAKLRAQNAIQTAAALDNMRRDQGVVDKLFNRR